MEIAMYVAFGLFCLTVIFILMACVVEMISTCKPDFGDWSEEDELNEFNKTRHP